MRDREFPSPKGAGKLQNPYMTGTEDWNALSNEESLVGVVQHTTPITSLPFVHTARRLYRLSSDMNLVDQWPARGKRAE